MKNKNHSTWYQVLPYTYIIMTVYHQNRNRHSDQWNKIENLGIEPTNPLNWFLKKVQKQFNRAIKYPWTTKEKKKKKTLNLKLTAYAKINLKWA